MPARCAARTDRAMDVHLMLLEDEMLTYEIRRWIKERPYNAEWAADHSSEPVVRRFDEMGDEYLRERKADLEQGRRKRILRHMKGRRRRWRAPPAARAATQQDLLPG